MTVDIPVVLVGEADPDALITLEHATVAIEAESHAHPRVCRGRHRGLPVGTQILAKDLKLTEGSTLSLDEEALVVNLVAAPTAEDIEAEFAEAEADLGVEHDEPTSETESDETTEDDGASEAGEGDSGTPGQE